MGDCCASSGRITMRGRAGPGRGSAERDGLVDAVRRYNFRPVLDRPAVIGIALIVSGVLVLQFFSNTQLRPTEGPAHSLPRNTMAPSAT
jgi:hypothetical protein